ncbi:protocatechuate 3,4-dioxygenase beta chain-like [Mya arenaria]|uniref:protocatechuate 3,4-dioxygenase beta chain-like n=1 Tax=Mya arenaria TaxID=6604 RepID=UPI0022DFEE62|nr:protocatechuate 3,4-dioxygenase beta chain-like [Mya arenaria]
MNIIILILAFWSVSVCYSRRIDVCKPTTPDVLGPYYYPDPPLRRQICDRDRAFHGQRHLLVEGRVLDESCKPIPDARIEVWQADFGGHYLFKDKCRGHMFSGQSGHFAFLTLRPGKYSTDPTKTLFRPAHIHFRVVKPGFDILITQMYFNGDSNLGKNDSCRDCSSKSADLVVKLHEMCADNTKRYCFNIAHFDIVLKSGDKIDVVQDSDDSLPELLDIAEVGK